MSPFSPHRRRLTIASVVLRVPAPLITFAVITGFDLFAAIQRPQG